jgi:hypothetical protein
MSSLIGPTAMLKLDIRAEVDASEHLHSTLFRLTTIVLTPSSSATEKLYDPTHPKTRTADHQSWRSRDALKMGARDAAGNLTSNSSVEVARR